MFGIIISFFSGAAAADSRLITNLKKRLLNCVYVKVAPQSFCLDGKNAPNYLVKCVFLVLNYNKNILGGFELLDGQKKLMLGFLWHICMVHLYRGLNIVHFNPTLSE